MFYSNIIYFPSVEKYFFLRLRQAILISKKYLFGASLCQSVIMSTTLPYSYKSCSF